MGLVEVYIAVGFITGLVVFLPRRYRRDEDA